ncbi:UDP-glucose 4-epimerase GalE [Thiohalorhabdus methylotrophus]|uniref:UDP-glucose 4-epimerase n=1 Tax=Thiohalorhabdus methylotrophus TaxID=3242694 RepID=A0ABV4TV43_9GAMM
MGGVLVTGGAGYIGSHVVRQLGERHEQVVVLDDLSTGHAGAVLHGELVLGDAGDATLIRELLQDYRLDAVMHFAARTVVPESVSDPLKYYRENSEKTRALAEAALEAGVENFIFSSSAAVYGIPPSIPVEEDAPLYPINPYGSSKLVSEWMLRDVAASGALRPVSLRYFNVAGADPGGRIGQSTPEATLLIKVACEAAIGLREEVAIYGTDYSTPDGTGVRDFIHVEDLASAHIQCLDHLRSGGQAATYNVGYGHGYSVREVLEAVERVHGAELPVREADRRPGDPPALVADTGRIRTELAWEPRYDDLDEIVRSALAWEQKLCGAHA